jgi:hypothetical protein
VSAAPPGYIEYLTGPSIRPLNGWPRRNSKQQHWTAVLPDAVHLRCQPFSTSERSHSPVGANRLMRVTSAQQYSLGYVKYISARGAGYARHGQALDNSTHGAMVASSPERGAAPAIPQETSHRRVPKNRGETR